MFDPCKDILERIAEEPTWWDVNGVPRYGEPPEGLQPYMRRVKCQSCGRIFRVCLVHGVYHRYGNVIGWEITDIEDADGKKLWRMTVDVERAIPDEWSYGDAPWHEIGGYRCGGETMTCDPDWTWPENA